MEYEYLPIEQVKKGDIVQCLNNSIGQFTKNKLYIVKDLYTKYGSIGVEFDDNGSTTNGWAQVTLS